MFDLLIYKNIQQHISLSDTELEYLQTKFTIKSIKRKDRILSQGQICQKIVFVEHGSLRAYNLNEDGKESTIMFAMQNWWITDMDCFVNKKASSLSIEALEDCQVIELSLDSLNELYSKVPKFERLFRILFQSAYIREQKRALHYLSNSTQERYVYFVEKYPELVKKITQKQISSYLGVTPEFLSSIKKKPRLKLS